MKPRGRAARWVSRVGVVAVMMLGVGGCGRSRQRPALAPVGREVVPRASGPIVLDGKCGEPSWQTSFRSPTFIDALGRRAPSTQVRATADDQNLYLEVYVADIDLESRGDLIKLDLGTVQMTLTPRRADVPAGVRAAMDVDGTIDDPNDHDEEWVTELAVPWSVIGSHQFPFRALRVDVGNGEPPHALAWPRSAPVLLVFDAHA